jgi:photosystem II stability/assembly factor-like uncharacterized protein
MKELLKITLTLFITLIIVLGFAMPLNPVGNWYQQFMPNLGGRQIRDITFLDSLTGYAISTRLSVSDSSLILKTSDGGNNWTIVYAPIGFIFKKIQFINQLTGYVGGTGLFKTTNGGNSWSDMNTSISLEDMSFINNDTAWYVYSEAFTGGVFFTSTGGASWVQQFSGGNQNPEKIYMYNVRIGFISDNSGTPSIRRTTNGGLNWDMNVNGQYYRDIVFADSLTGWYSYGNNVYKTTNGGNNWQQQTLPYGGNLISVGINEFSAIDQDTLFAVGGEIITGIQSRGIIYRTVNGGNNWAFQIPDTSIHVPGPYNYLQFVNSKYGWAYTLGFYGGIHTTTGGDPVWITAVEQINSEVPKEFKLFQNYPNPFNPNTNIGFRIADFGLVTLKIYDLTGREIVTLINEEFNAGEYKTNWNAASYSSGVYFYKLTVTAGKEVFTETKKMLMIK